MNVFQVVKAEDARLMKIVRRIEDTAAGKPEERRLLVNQARIQFRAQQLVESRHLLPALRVHGGGDAVAEAFTASGRDVDAVLEKALEGDPSAGKYSFVLGDFASSAQRHVHWKEREMLARMERLLLEEESETLGEAVSRDLAETRRELAGTA